jgi:8-oxo-dGTP pyrophosphatase MutT (NUDIX family)
METPRPIVRLPSGPGHAFDWAARAALWCAYRVFRAWWFIARPQHHGAVIAVWLDGRILMIRHSYRGRLSWPGGGVKQGEDPAEAAIRELREEMGFETSREDLVFAARILERWEYRYDHVSIFELKLTAPPALALDGREVIGAAFMNPEDALAEPLVPFVESYLRQKRALPPRSG